MTRRQFITLLGGAAVTWPLAARAQQPQATVPVIGYLFAGSPDPSANLLRAFRKGLNEVGYFEGQNVAIEFRAAYNEFERLPDLAADLVRRRVAAIVTPGSVAAALAAKTATATIPVVFGIGTDPVQAGLVTSLNRPGGNVTGVSYIRCQALLVSPGPLFGNRRTQIAMLAMRYAMPAMYYDREFTEIGGLISYGTSLVDQYRQTGIYTGRVLRVRGPLTFRFSEPQSSN